MRIYELAKEFDLSSKDLLAIIMELGLTYSKHLEKLTTEDEEIIRQHLSNDKVVVDGVEIIKEDDLVKEDLPENTTKLLVEDKEEGMNVIMKQDDGETQLVVVLVDEEGDCIEIESLHKLNKLIVDKESTQFDLVNNEVITKVIEPLLMFKNNPLFKTNTLMSEGSTGVISLNTDNLIKDHQPLGTVINKVEIDREMIPSVFEVDFSECEFFSEFENNIEVPYMEEVVETDTLFEGETTIQKGEYGSLNIYYHLLSQTDDKVVYKLTGFEVLREPSTEITYVGTKPKKVEQEDTIIEGYIEDYNKELKPIMEGDEFEEPLVETEEFSEFDLDNLSYTDSGSNLEQKLKTADDLVEKLQESTNHLHESVKKVEEAMDNSKLFRLDEEGRNKNKTIIDDEVGNKNNHSLSIGDLAIDLPTETSEFDLDILDLDEFEEDEFDLSDLDEDFALLERKRKPSHLVKPVSTSSHNEETVEDNTKPSLFKNFMNKLKDLF